MNLIDSVSTKFLKRRAPSEIRCLILHLRLQIVFTLSNISPHLKHLLSGKWIFYIFSGIFFLVVGSVLVSLTDWRRWYINLRLLFLKLAKAFFVLHKSTNLAKTSSLSKSIFRNWLDYKSYFEYKSLRYLIVIIED